MEQSFKDLERVAAAYDETNDCTVKAIALACDVSYGKAHRLLAKMGRKKGRGVTMAVIAKALNQLGYPVDIHGMLNHSAVDLTIKRFAREYSEGRYIVCTKAHAIAVVEGELKDWTADTAGRRKVVSVMKIA